MHRRNLGIVWAGVALVGTIPVAGPSRGRIGMAHDWSHRHVLFSNPPNVEQGMRVREDPRFWQQLQDSTKGHSVKSLPRRKKRACADIPRWIVPRELFDRV
jgi:hypothetical protein